MLKHKLVAKNYTLPILGFFLTIGAAGYSVAAPAISQVSLMDGEAIEHGARLYVQGSNFGLKEIAAPVLVDYVDRAFEYGNENKTNSTLRNMARIPLGMNGDNGAIWATGTSNFLYSTDAPHRHRNSVASYYFEGENEWIGRPVAYGGADGWDTPTDSPQLYFSWWYKNKYHSTWYWRFSPSSQNGVLEVGEELYIEGRDKEYSKGVYVGIDSEGLHNAVLYNHRNANLLVNTRIRGAKSGAVTTFPNQARGGSGDGFEIVGSKLARVWDDPSGSNGFRSSVALHDAYASSSRMYYSLNLTPDKWVHLEYELDTNKGFLRFRQNGVIMGEVSFSPDIIYEGKYSPTLALLGTNAKQLKLQESWISEIYFDNSLQRVVIGNSDIFEDVTHHELQRPIKWSDTEIEFEVNLGALSFDQGLYVYVFDESGAVNEKGYALCSGESCPMPPSKINLLVE